MNKLKHDYYQPVPEVSENIALCLSKSIGELQDQLQFVYYSGVMLIDQDELKELELKLVKEQELFNVEVRLK